LLSLFLYLQAKEKEERLLRRQINRERLEEKRKQKAAEKTKSLKTGSQNAKGMRSITLAPATLLLLAHSLWKKNIQLKILIIGF